MTALITDPNWLRNWGSKHAGVSFHSADTLYAGQKGTVAIFFSNPTLKNGQAQLSCDVVVRDAATGSTSRIAPQICFNGPVKRPMNILLTSVMINLSEDAHSRRGLIRIDAGVTDLNSRTRVPVSLAIMGDPSGPRR